MVTPLLPISFLEPHMRALLAHGTTFNSAGGLGVSLTTYHRYIERLMDAGLFDDQGDPTTKGRTVLGYYAALYGDVYGREDTPTEPDVQETPIVLTGNASRQMGFAPNSPKNGILQITEAASATDHDHVLIDQDSLKEKDHDRSIVEQKSPGHAAHVDEAASEPRTDIAPSESMPTKRKTSDPVAVFANRRTLIGSLPENAGLMERLAVVLGGSEVKARQLLDTDAKRNRPILDGCMCRLDALCDFVATQGRDPAHYLYCILAGQNPRTGKVVTLEESVYRLLDVDCRCLRKAERVAAAIEKRDRAYNALALDEAAAQEEEAAPEPHRCPAYVTSAAPPAGSEEDKYLNGKYAQFFTKRAARLRRTSPYVPANGGYA